MAKYFVNRNNVKFLNLKLSTFVKCTKTAIYKYESSVNAFSDKLLSKLWKSQTTVSKEKTLIFVVRE